MHCSHTARGMVSGNFTDFHLLCLNHWTAQAQKGRTPATPPFTLFFLPIHLVLCILFYAYFSIHIVSQASQSMYFFICYMFYDSSFMHLVLWMWLYAYFSLCLDICILFIAYNSLHLVLCLLFYGFHSIHLLECISFYTSRSMHLIICISFYASQVYIHFILYITFYAFSSIWYILTIFETSSRTDIWTWRPIAKPGHNCKLVYGPLVCLMLAINHLGKRRRTVTACAMLKRMATQHQCNFTDK